MDIYFRNDDTSKKAHIRVGTFVVYRYVRCSAVFVASCGTSWDGLILMVQSWDGLFLIVYCDAMLRLIILV